MEGWIYIGLERDIFVQGHNGVRLLGVGGEGGGRGDETPVYQIFYPPPPSKWPETCFFQRGSSCMWSSCMCMIEWSVGCECVLGAVRCMRCGVWEGGQYTPKGVPVPPPHRHHCEMHVYVYVFLCLLCIGGILQSGC